MNPEDVLPVAVRVWATRDRPTSKPRRVRKQRQRAYPSEVLVFDIETRDLAGQQLMVGVWRLYRDAPGAPAGRTCIEEGLLYPDDLPGTDLDGWAVLQRYAAKAVASTAAGFGPRLLVVSQSWWLEHRLHNYGYRHAGRCTVVGFNSPFDLGGLARWWGPAKGGFTGGWSLSFQGRRTDTGGWQDRPGHPRLLLRSIDPRRTLFSWASVKAGEEPEFGELSGRFVDLRTLTFALTDRAHSLESACTAFGDPFEKADVVYGRITDAMLTYARQDVAHTAALYVNCLTEIDRHPGVELIPQRLYSPASVGTAYMKAWGLTPALEKFGELDPQLLGWSLATFYGGRAEARIVRTPMPVVVLDATSMYPLQNALLDTWSLMTAERVTVADVTEQARVLINYPDLLTRLFDPTMWSHDIGVSLVELDHPRDVRLPVRASYTPSGIGYGIGNNPLSYDGTVWYQLPDVLAAALHGDLTTFTIRRAIRFVGHGSQPGLRPVTLRGHFEIDPATDNPFIAMINERHRINQDTTVDSDERERLDRFLKITANASSYGVLARFDRRTLTTPVAVTVHGPDDEAFTDCTRQPEDPGPYCFPPVAAALTAGARLLLAMLERCVTDLGGSFVFMDTDSIAIVASPNGGQVRCDNATGNTARALSFDEVHQIAGRFTSLNVYAEHISTPELDWSIWKAEKNSLTEPLWCMAIAAKSYTLYRPHRTGPQLVTALDENSDPTEGLYLDLEDWSEHGLGLYLDPLLPGAQRDERGRRIWTRQASTYILCTLLGLPADLPPWAELPALTRFSVSSPAHAAWFRVPSTSGPQPDKPRPGGFGLIAHPDGLIPSQTGGLPAAPYTDDARAWLTQPWYDRRTGEPLTITTTTPTDPDRLERGLAAGGVRVKTLGDVLNAFIRRPEHKSLAPNGRPADGATRGQLLRRPVHSGPPITALIGKEGHKLAERQSGQLAEPDIRHYRDGSRDDWQTLIRPILNTIAVDVIADATGLSPRRVRDWLKGRARPHAGASGHIDRARALAVTHARTELLASGRDLPANDAAAMYAYSTQLTSNLSPSR